MTNSVSTITCVRCKKEIDREIACKHSVYTNKQNVSTQRYICRGCAKIAKRAYRGVRSIPTVVSTTPEESDDIELVSEEYVVPEGW